LYDGSSFSLKSGVSVSQIFFLILNFLILVLLQRPPASENGRSFHGDVVTFISVFDGIEDDLEA
jgi:hypothetical protein